MRNRWKTLAAGVIATVAFAMPAAASAAQVGQICNTVASYWVLSQPADGYAWYLLGTGAGFAVEGFAGPDYYVGHGNGGPTGYYWRNNINQGTCHW
jgi:septal ring-binding cell division protein DamX